jgi:hypothetical protein
MPATPARSRRGRPLQQATLNQTLLDLQKSLFSLTASRDREQSFESDQLGRRPRHLHLLRRSRVSRARPTPTATASSPPTSSPSTSTPTCASPPRRSRTPPPSAAALTPTWCWPTTPTTSRPPTCLRRSSATSSSRPTWTPPRSWVDGKSAGHRQQGHAAAAAGHRARSAHHQGRPLGYEPDGPREEQVYPGQDTTVSVRILIARLHNHAAVEHFDKGIEDYNKGNAANYKKAADEFRAALALDPEILAGGAVSGPRGKRRSIEDQESLAAFKPPSTTDPDYMEARASYAGALLDAGRSGRSGPPVEHRHQRASPPTAWAGICSRRPIRARAITRTARPLPSRPSPRRPRTPRRTSGSPSALRQLNIPADAIREYNLYLSLSNFDSGFGGKLNYYLAGFLFGAGRKKRAAQTDIWRELRGQANLGICDCQWMLKHYDRRPSSDCQQALTLHPQGPLRELPAGHRVYAQEFNQQNSVGYLAAAKEHFVAGRSQRPRHGRSQPLARSTSR